MANTLNIELTVFQQRGSDEKIYGFIANDDYAKTFYRSNSTSFDAVKAEFPTRESIFNHVIGEDNFSEFGQYVRFEQDQPVIEDEEDAPVSGVYFDGFDGLYD